MPVITTKARELHPAGVYRATFRQAEERTSERTNGTYLMWRFDARTKEGATFAITAASSINSTPRAKLWSWTEALLRRPLVVGESIELNDLAGRECLIDVQIEVKGGEEYSAVMAVLPFPDA